MEERVSKAKVTHESTENGVSECKKLAHVLNVMNLLRNHSLRIPKYQRPYKWSVRNVNQFIQDLIEHSEKDQYRIGNMVVHHHNGGYDIVDGQQRFITLLLIIKAIHDHRSNGVSDLWTYASEYLDGKHIDFSHPVTKENIYHNYQAIKQQSATLYQIRSFIKDRVEIVQFRLKDQSEAFQFFDSQNARGRELFPHDLLKAFHLREFPTDEEGRKKDVVEVWEEMESEELAELFEAYLFRIRAWSKGHKVWYFTKEKIDWFKGINIEKTEAYPFVNTLRLMHNRIDDISKDMPVYFGSRKYVFPFQLDQTIINGRRFFEMVTVYKNMIDEITDKDFTHKELDDDAKDILEAIYSYEKHTRTGDTYVRRLFQASLIYYIDRFGMHGISEAVKKLFVWSFRKRLEMFAVRVESVANHAVEDFHKEPDSNAFKVISEAQHHNDIRSLSNPPILKMQRGELTEITELMERLDIHMEGVEDEQ